MHGQGVILEVEFQEISSKQYIQMFVEALRDRFDKELSSDQLNALNEVIEQSRLNGQAPVDLAKNLDDNWEAIFE